MEGIRYICAEQPALGVRPDRAALRPRSGPQGSSMRLAQNDGTHNMAAARKLLGLARTAHSVLSQRWPGSVNVGTLSAALLYRAALHKTKT